MIAFEAYCFSDTLQIRLEFFEDPCIYTQQILGMNRYVYKRGGYEPENLLGDADRKDNN